MSQKHKIINYIHITVIMSLSCCFQRLTWVKSTSLQLLGDKSSSYVQIISNYVHLTVIICTYLVILSFDANKPPYTCVNMSPVHPGYKNSSVLIQTIYPSLISLMVSVDFKYHVYIQTISELRSCVKVEVDVLGSCP